METGHNVNYDNADTLARRLIDADPQNKGRRLDSIREMRNNFEKYLSTDSEGNLVPAVMNEEYIIDKALGFIHSNFKIPFRSAYMESRFKNDFSPASFYDCCNRINNKEEKIGDCLGLSQVLKYLLDSKGIDSEVVFYEGHTAFDDGHAALEANINKNIVPIAATRLDGYGVGSDLKREGRLDLVSVVTSDMGTYLCADGKYIKGMHLIQEAIDIDPDNEHARLDLNIARRLKFSLEFFLD
jgi:hypothetical protein